MPLMAIGSGAVASVALFAAPLRFTDTYFVERSLLDSERDATSKCSRSTHSSSDSEELSEETSYAYETLIDFRGLLYEAMSSEGFLRMAGILCHVSLAGNEKG